jgi:coenzyme F420-reducing hydrogenase gamma subunit
MAQDNRPKLAVWKFASCDGCQLSFLDLEDELLAVAAEIEVAVSLEASRAVVEGPYDLSLVEGSITTEHDGERIKEIRASSKRLVTIGACAIAGGIQALRNRGCYGCYGPMESPNTASLSRWWASLGESSRDLQRAYRTFNTYAEAFREESKKHGA